MIYYDPNTIFLIGGIQNGVISNKTWIINPNQDFQMREGPTLKVERWGHSCGKMICKDGNIVIVVAGGISDNHHEERHERGMLQNVEILNPTSDKGWEYGMLLTYKCGPGARIFCFTRVKSTRIKFTWINPTWLSRIYPGRFYHCRFYPGKINQDFILVDFTRVKQNILAPGPH